MGYRSWRFNNFQHTAEQYVAFSLSLRIFKPYLFSVDPHYFAIGHWRDAPLASRPLRPWARRGAASPAAQVQHTQHTQHTPAPVFHRAPVGQMAPVRDVRGPRGPRGPGWRRKMSQSLGESPTKWDWFTKDDQRIPVVWTIAAAVDPDLQKPLCLGGNGIIHPFEEVSTCPRLSLTWPENMVKCYPSNPIKSEIQSY